MKSRTIAHCFGFLAVLIAVCLIGEFLFAVFSGHSPQSLHKSFPLFSFPAAVNKFNAPPSSLSEEEILRREENPRLRLILKNGRQMEGIRVSEDAAWVTLKVDGSEVGFKRSEIARIEQAPLKSPANEGGTGSRADSGSR